MVMASQPQRGRAVTSVPEAARVLGRDVRTVRRMVESGELEGGASEHLERRQWFVYTDQLTAGSVADHAPADTAGAELAALREENARLRARVVAAEEGERLLLASQATMREALQRSQSMITAMVDAAAGMDRGTDGYRDAAESYRAAADEFRGSAQRYRHVVGEAHSTIDLLQDTLDRYSDTITQYVTPGDIGGMNR